MKELKDWIEILKGLYRYVVAANAAYEIHVSYYAFDTDILTAKASLFIVGDWRDNKTGDSFFERECLLAEQPVFECHAAAVKDYEANNG